MNRLDKYSPKSFDICLPKKAIYWNAEIDRNRIKIIRFVAIYLYGLVLSHRSSVDFHVKCGNI